MKLFKGIMVVLYLLVLTHFMEGCGSAEPIKSYLYPVTKYQLEKAVEKVLQSNPHIVIQSTEPQDSVIGNSNSSTDTSTAIKNSSNNPGSDTVSITTIGKAVIQIEIKVGEIDKVYVFRYRGDEQDWKRSSSSVIFIQYAGDMNGNGISQGQNEHGEFKSKTAKELTSLFEQEVIGKIDNELKVKHTERLGPLNDLR